MDLQSQLLDALQPRGLKERLRRRMSGGLSVPQIIERLPEAFKVTLLGEGVAQAGEGLAQRQRMQDAVGRQLNEMVREGLVTKHRVQMSRSMGSKGQRDVLVDVYRLPV